MLGNERGILLLVIISVTAYGNKADYIVFIAQRINIFFDAGITNTAKAFIIFATLIEDFFLLGKTMSMSICQRFYVRTIGVIMNIKRYQCAASDQCFVIDGMQRHGKSAIFDKVQNIILNDFDFHKISICLFLYKIRR
jgi:hypothetical protein